LKEAIAVYGPGSSVGIATDYGLDGPGIESETMVVLGKLKWSGDTRSGMLGVGMAARCAAVFPSKI
jgi:hypothetical protein